MASFINMNNYNYIDVSPEERLSEMKSEMDNMKNLLSFYRHKMTPSQIHNLIDRHNELEEMIDQLNGLENMVDS